MTTLPIAGEDPVIAVLAPVPEAAGRARDLVAAVFGGWGMDTYIPRLVVSELVANALHASAGAEFIVVRAHRDRGAPTIEVWDRGPRMPAVRDAGPADEGGRGLLIVDSVCARWGVRPCTEGGKVVWAELSGAGAARDTAPH